MSLIIVKAKKSIMPEELLSLGVPPKGEEDFAWLETCIRTEDIMEFYKRSEAKVVVLFYDERPSLVIRESFENFVKALSLADYNISSYEEAE